MCPVFEAALYRHASNHRVHRGAARDILLELGSEKIDNFIDFRQALAEYPTLIMNIFNKEISLGRAMKLIKSLREDASVDGDGTVSAATVMEPFAKYRFLSFESSLYDIRDERQLNSGLHACLQLHPGKAQKAFIFFISRLAGDYVDPRVVITPDYFERCEGDTLYI